jgi:putative ABC transport system permease protein
MLCVLVVAGFFVSVTLIIQGAEDSLLLATERLGADIVVVAEGADPSAEGALLMGRPTASSMPATIVARVAAIPGVAVASPQLYVGTIKGSPGSQADEWSLIAYHPETDFTVHPWLERELIGGLGVGEAIGGSLVVTPGGAGAISVNGYQVALKNRLTATGTGLDRSLFFTFATLERMQAQAPGPGEGQLELSHNKLSSVMVKVHPGADIDQVALQIMQEVPEVTPIPSLALFRAFRKQLGAVVQSYLVVLGIVWGISILIIGLIFTIAANERRREIAVLRALGSTRGFVFRSLLAEAALLALGDRKSVV